MNPLLIQLKCKSCQGDLDPNTAVGGVIECKFCGNKFTLPKSESNNEILESLRDAERELDRGISRKPSKPIKGCHRKVKTSLRHILVWRLQMQKCSISTV